MFRLFYAENSAAYSTRVIFEEIGAEYELIATDITPGGERDPELLAVNPNGWVPVLLHGDLVMHEASAIAIYLTDLYPQAGLAPAVGDPARGRFLQWLVYFSNTLQTAYQMTYYPYRFCSGPEHHESSISRSGTRLREAWGYVDGAIGDAPWIAGDGFSAADIYLYMLSTWLSPDLGHPAIEEFPSVARIADKVTQRPSVRLVFGL